MLLTVALVFLLAGTVKGIVGLGMPTVALAILVQLMPPVQAAALLVVPALVTNVWQCFAGPPVGALLRRMAPMLLAVPLGCALGIGFMTRSTSQAPVVALGLLLALYAVIALALPRLRVSPRQERWAGPVAGLATGVLTGATGLSAVPTVPYLSALGLDRDQQVQALGLCFMVCSVSLGLALGYEQELPASRLWHSAAAVAPALLGMAIGQRIRNRIDPLAFRRVFLLSILALGLFMAARAMFRA